MSEKLRVVRLKHNPKSATSTRRRRHIKRPPPAKRVRQKRMRPARAGWLIEVMHEKNSLYRFRYWDGRKLVTTRTMAMVYPTERKATASAGGIIAMLPADYRFARAVPA